MFSNVISHVQINKDILKAQKYPIFITRSCTNLLSMQILLCYWLESGDETKLQLTARLMAMVHYWGTGYTESNQERMIMSHRRQRRSIKLSMHTLAKVVVLHTFKNFTLYG